MDPLILIDDAMAAFDARSQGISSHGINCSNAEDGIFELAFGVNAMPADALAHKVARASAGVVLVEYDRQDELLFQS